MIDDPLIEVVGHLAHLSLFVPIGLPVVYALGRRETIRRKPIYALTVAATSFAVPAVILLAVVLPLAHVHERLTDALFGHGLQDALLWSTLTGITGWFHRWWWLLATWGLPLVAAVVAIVITPAMAARFRVRDGNEVAS